MKKFVAIVVLLTLGGLLYVYEEVEAVKIGYRIRKQDEFKVQLLDRARALKYNIAQLKAPHNLERRLSAQRIMLESPKSWNTLVMPGPTGKKLASSMAPAPLLGRFFMGTAQAEAKESAR